MRHFLTIILSFLIVAGESTVLEEDLDPITRRIDNLEKSLEQKDNEIMELQEKNTELYAKIEDVRAENFELRGKIEEVRNPPFGYFCSYSGDWAEADSIIKYDRMLYSSYFGLQGDAPGIDINTGIFEAGFSGTWRIDFSLWTFPDPDQTVNIFLYKNGVQIPETMFHSTRSKEVSGFDANTGGRSVLLHLDLGDQLYLRAESMTDYAYAIVFCVSMEQFDV